MPDTNLAQQLEFPPATFQIKFPIPENSKIPRSFPHIFQTVSKFLGKLGGRRPPFQDDQTLRRRAIIIVPLKPGKTRIVETRDLDFHEIPPRSLEPSSLRSANLHTFTGEIHPSNMFSLSNPRLLFATFVPKHVSFHALLTR